MQRPRSRLKPHNVRLKVRSYQPSAVVRTLTIIAFVIGDVRIGVRLKRLIEKYKRARTANFEQNATNAGAIVKRGKMQRRAAERVARVNDGAGKKL